MMPSTFVVTEATLDDCEAIIRIEFEACADDPGFSTIFPQGPTPTTLENSTGRLRNDLSDDPTCHVYVVRVEETREIVSFATWNFFEQPRSQDSLDEQMLMDDYHLPADANRSLGNRLIRNGLRKRHEIMGTQSYAYLAATGTATKWQRKGAASLLLEHGLFMADRQSLPSFVEGTSVAKGLYRKFGFVEVDQLRLDLAPWKEGDFWNVCMVRPARKNS